MRIYKSVYGPWLKPELIDTAHESKSSEKCFCRLIYEQNLWPVKPSMGGKEMSWNPSKFQKNVLALEASTRVIYESQFKN